MVSIAQRNIVVASDTASSPRLVLAPGRAARAVLDGGWWPRSRDPVAELPGLVTALTARYGPIRRLMLNSGSWDVHVRRLAIGDRVVRAGWFATVDPGVLIATTDTGEQIDLLVVPATATAATAESAMATAADPANRLRAPAILAARTAGPDPDHDLGVEEQADTVWDNEDSAPAEHASTTAAADMQPQP